jgi:predicted transcriptional regulator
MTYPASELRADLREIGISATELAAISGVRLSILCAWMDGQLDPCDGTVRAVLRALQSARALHRRHGFVPMDDDSIRWVKEQLAAVGALVR